MAYIEFENDILYAFGSESNIMYTWTPVEFERYTDCLVTPSMYHAMCTYVINNAPLINEDYKGSDVEPAAVDYYYGFSQNIRNYWHKCSIENLKKKADTISDKLQKYHERWINIIAHSDRTDIREAKLDKLSQLIDLHTVNYHNAMEEYNCEVFDWVEPPCQLIEVPDDEDFEPIIIDFTDDDEENENDVLRFLHNDEGLGQYNHADEI